MNICRNFTSRNAITVFSVFFFLRGVSRNLCQLFENKRTQLSTSETIFKEKLEELVDVLKMCVKVLAF